MQAFGMPCEHASERYRRFDLPKPTPTPTPTGGSDPTVFDAPKAFLRGFQTSSIGRLADDPMDGLDAETFEFPADGNRLVSQVEDESCNTKSTGSFA